MEDLLSSREENRHLDNGLDVTLRFDNMTCSVCLLMMLKVCRKTKTASGIRRMNVRDICRPYASNRVEWWL